MKTMNIMSIFKKCPFRGVPNRFGIEPGYQFKKNKKLLI